MRSLRLALLLLLAAPGAAWAADATITSQDLPIGVVRSPAAAVAPQRFDLVAFHWQGSGRVLFRTRSQAGHWSGWRRAAPEGEDLPDPASSEARARSGWQLGNPYWVGASDRVAFRLVGNVRRLRAWYVWSPVSRAPVRRVSMAGSPQIVPRSEWRANEAIKRAPPRYAKTVSLAIVHHTAGTNSYGPSASAAIVRGIELYHVRGNHWNDIGYNFLVDRYGQVFEGRAGGIDRNVIGAQAQGFNTGSVGVALIGNYNTGNVTSAERKALVSLVAWRLDVAHVDPLGTVDWVSGGNPKYRPGKTVELRAISGHRDTGFTSCPGTRLYSQLPSIAANVAATGLPKIYAPVVKGSLGGPISFSAQLSQPRGWTVTVRDPGGTAVARGTGRGAAIAWTWNSAGRRGGNYAWTMEAGAATRPAQGTFGRASVPAPAPAPAPAPSFLSALTVVPPVISPDGDGVADVLSVSYRLAVRASVTATVLDATGAVAATLFSAQLEGARTQSFPYTAQGLADGNYTLKVDAVTEDGRTAHVQAPFAIDRTLTGLMLSTATLTPNGDGLDDSLQVDFTLNAPAEVTVQIEQNGLSVAAVSSGSLSPGVQSAVWDGTSRGTLLPAGSYVVAVIVRGPFGETRHEAALTVAY
ncbi:MAG TPA: N-acetylmuramoyl-L-alanine amidase [Gaiellaceae bacterium]|nr:N-acetylmuramoyl-L-alanine amidase [Gaiellaceae bacterium]